MTSDELHRQDILDREKMLFEVRVDRAFALLIESMRGGHISRSQWRQSADQRVYSALSRYEQAIREI